MANRTVSLVGATIQNFVGHEDGTLILTFSNGQRLTIADSSKEHDSYLITRPGQTIVVPDTRDLPPTFAHGIIYHRLIAAAFAENIRF